MVRMWYWQNWPAFFLRLFWHSVDSFYYRVEMLLKCVKAITIQFWSMYHRFLTLKAWQCQIWSGSTTSVPVSVMNWIDWILILYIIILYGRMWSVFSTNTLPYRDYNSESGNYNAVINPSNALLLWPVGVCLVCISDQDLNGSWSTFWGRVLRCVSFLHGWSCWQES